MSWFPLARSVIRGEEFPKLSPATKAFYLILVSENNLHDRLMKSDAMLAAMLDVDISTIKRGRRSLKDLGWIEVIPGRKADRGTGKGMVTQYTRIRHALTRDLVASSDHYQGCDRSTFEALVWEVSEGRYDPADLVTWAVAEYWFREHEEQIETTGSYFITDRDLIGATGIADAPDRLKRLAEYRFQDGTPLFVLKRRGGKSVISQWLHVAGPDESDDARLLWERRFRGYQAKARKIADDKTAEERLRNGKGVSSTRIPAEKLNEWLHGESPKTRSRERSPAHV